MTLSRFLRALPLLLLAAACVTPEVAVAPRYGRVELEGEFGIGTNVTATASLEQAGLGDEEGVLGARADLKWGAPHLTVSTQTSEHSGSGTLDVALMQGGITLPGGAAVASDLELGLHQAALTFDLVPTDLVELGLGFGVTAADVDLRFRSGSEEIRTDELALVPVLALRGGVRFWRMEVGVLATGLQVDWDDDSFRLLDVDARALWRFAGGVGVAGHLMLGYRWLDLDLEYEDSGEEVELDATFQGPYLGLVLSL